MFFDDVDNNSSLDINLPSPDDSAALESLSHSFSRISTSLGLFTGVIGAIDGWLVCTGSPIDRAITNKRSYFSGHYSGFGINIQAICDGHLRFIFFAVAAPGGTNDARALQRCYGFNGWLQQMKGKGYFLVGDNAYVLRNELLIPFSGRASTELQRTYNFFCLNCAFELSLLLVE